MNWMNWIIRKTTIVMFIAMGILVLVSTIARIMTVFTEQLAWTEEASRYLMIWIALLASVVAVQTNAHFRMTVVLDSLPPKISKMGELVVDLISLAYLGFLGYWGIVLVGRLIKMWQLAPVMKIPVWIAYSVIPIGSIGMLAGTLWRSLRQKKGENKNDKTEEEVEE